MKLDTVLVTAYANAPKGTAFYRIYEYMGVVLEVDKKTDIIVDCSVTLITDTARNYTSKLFIGEKLSGDISQLISDIETQYLTATTSALITALKQARQRYLDSKAQITKRQCEDDITRKE